jgi:predicted nucleotidyltransferase
VREAIDDALAAIESEQSVRVLFACESGSRAWGFASPDSDYDVRFVYVHHLDWYLRVSAGRESIERMLPLDLDLSGWELRKALALFGTGNATAFEHLGSDIVYRDVGGLRAALLALLPSFFNPIAAGHHYLGLASRMHAEHLGGAQVNLKKLFYVLRPLAAYRWIELRSTMPPTAFAGVLAGIDLEAEPRGWIDELMVRKQTIHERGESPLDPRLRRWIADWLARSRETADSLPRSGGNRDDLDRLSATTVRAWD